MLWSNLAPAACCVPHRLSRTDALHSAYLHEARTVPRAAVAFPRRYKGHLRQLAAKEPARGVYTASNSQKAALYIGDVCHLTLCSAATQL